MADYDLNLGAIDVDFGNLGALGELAEAISPKVGDIVGAKIKEILVFSSCKLAVYLCCVGPYFEVP